VTNGDREKEEKGGKKKGNGVLSQAQSDSVASHRRGELGGVTPIVAADLALSKKGERVKANSLVLFYEMATGTGKEKKVGPAGRRQKRRKGLNTYSSTRPDW